MARLPRLAAVGAEAEAAEAAPPLRLEEAVVKLPRPRSAAAPIVVELVALVALAALAALAALVALVALAVLEAPAEEAPVEEAQAAEEEAVAAPRMDSMVAVAPLQTDSAAAAAEQTCRSLVAVVAVAGSRSRIPSAAALEAVAALRAPEAVAGHSLVVVVEAAVAAAVAEVENPYLLVIHRTVEAEVAEATRQCLRLLRMVEAEVAEATRQCLRLLRMAVGGEEALTHLPQADGTVLHPWRCCTKMGSRRDPAPHSTRPWLMEMTECEAVVPHKWAT